MKSRLIVYNIFMNGKHLYSSDAPWIDPIVNPVYELSVNKAGTFTFTMPKTHKLIDEIAELKSWITILQFFYVDGVKRFETIPFAGRVLTIETDLVGNKNVTCEGFMSMYNDNYSMGLEMVNLALNGYTARGLVRETNYKLMSFNPYQNPDSSDFNLGLNYFDTGSYNQDNVKNVYDDVKDGRYPDITTLLEEDRTIRPLIDYLKMAIDEAGGFLIVAYYWVLTSKTSDIYKGSRSRAVKNLYPTVFYFPYDVDLLDPETPVFNSLLNYPNENYEDMGLVERRYWLPKFNKFKNVVSFTKENSMQTKFSGIIPVGKDGLRIPVQNNNEDRYCLWNSDLVARYGTKLAISIEYPDISTQSDLLNAGENWLNRHAKFWDKLYKYTITGPEPCVFGYGDVPIMLMRDVIVQEGIEDDSEPIIGDYGQLPCLSLKIDIQNPQNNQYVIGPYIDDRYTQTSISTETVYDKQAAKKNS